MQLSVRGDTGRVAAQRGGEATLLRGEAALLRGEAALLRDALVLGHCGRGQALVKGHTNE
jgi:hypothetical protein